jgi:hypothetical protein
MKEGWHELEFIMIFSWLNSSFPPPPDWRPVPLFRRTQLHARNYMPQPMRGINPMETRFSQHVVLFLIDSLSAEPYSW